MRPSNSATSDRAVNPRITGELNLMGIGVRGFFSLGRSTFGVKGAFVAVASAPPCTGAFAGTCTVPVFSSIANRLSSKNGLYAYFSSVPVAVHYMVSICNDV